MNINTDIDIEIFRYPQREKKKERKVISNKNDTESEDHKKIYCMCRT